MQTDLVKVRLHVKTRKITLTAATVPRNKLKKKAVILPVRSR